MSKWAPIDFIMLILTLSISMLLLGLVYDLISVEKVATAEQNERALSFVLALVAILNGYVISSAKSD